MRVPWDALGVSATPAPVGTISTAVNGAGMWGWNGMRGIRKERIFLQ